VVLDTYVFMLMGIAGGKPLSTVAMLNTHTYCWSMPILDGTSPPARMGATATRVGTDLYIFGGSDGRTSLRDLHVLVYVTWFTPSYAGKPPDCRVGHTSNFIGARLYVLGGASQGVAHNDLYVLDPNLQTWTRPPMYGTPPDALVGHSAVVLGSELIVWGGGDGKAAHAAFSVIDTLNMLWSRPTTSGSQPSARVGHTAVLHDSKMFVFGGYGQRQYWNELVALDTGILVWIRPHTVGQPPAPCVLHSATLVGHVMVVYGGSFNEVALNQLVAFDTVNMSWTNIGSFLWEGPRPLPLFGHGAVAIDHRLLIFGGTTGGVPDSLASYLFGRGFVTGYAAGARNDLVVMDLQARTFSMPKYAGRRPPPAYRHTVSTRKGKIFVFGGVGGDGHMSLLDTGHAPGEVASTGVLKKAPSTLDAAAAGLFAAEMGAEFGRTDGRGLDATRASQLVSLLQELDMNKYTRLFLRQEVDVDSLLTLSDADLKDMGVTALGARRKLTVAIHKHKLQQMSEKGGGGSTAIKAGGAAAALAAAAATAMKVKSTAAAGSSSAADATSSRRTEDVDGRTQGAQTHGFVVAGQVYRGRYLLNGKTYIGGSARVVLGEDVKTGQPIAVKVHSSRTYFAREMKLLRAMQSEYIVRFLDAFDEEDAPSAVVLEGGSCSLAELLAEGQLQPVERKHVLERLCLAVDFVHSRGFVLVDLKPANIVIFGSLLTFKLIDLECLRKNGDTVHFKLTPFYAAPELASAALETMRLGALPPLEYSRARGPVDATSDQWGPTLGKGALLSESPTLARAVAQASSVVNTAGDVGDFNKDELRQLEAPLKLPNGKPLRASVAMDIWAVGLIAFELFTNEPFFAGCSDDVALQVLASSTPLELPMARIADTQAQHLLAKILVKRPKERATIEMILRHAYLVGGLDTQQVGGSFAMLHESQSAFKSELDRLQAGLGPMGGESHFGEPRFGSPAFGGGSSVLKKAHGGGSSGGGDRKARFAG
jgi:serine/threonine protein kinase